MDRVSPQHLFDSSLVLLLLISLKIYLQFPYLVRLLSSFLRLYFKFSLPDACKKGWETLG